MLLLFAFPLPRLGLYFSVFGERSSLVVSSILLEIIIATELCPKELTDFHKGVVVGLKIQNYTRTFFMYENIKYNRIEFDVLIFFQMK